jgi:2-polyprenyl-3-methyl-5-hydroxy-6-metoxy-1,4-benzoquinol methylase
MIVSYGLVDEFQGWDSGLFKSLLTEYGSKRILEIGSGANPTLSPDDVRSNGLAYVTSDLSSEELEKADDVFERLVLDLSIKDLDPALSGKFDFVFSRMVGEHVKDGSQYYRNIYSLLRGGGVSAHCFSTLWALPFAFNRLAPEPIARMALDLFNPRDRHRHEKFQAYYNWSRGPTKTMIRRFKNVGFEVLRYDGYFGHPYYKRIPLLHNLEAFKSRHLLRHPIPQLCSYATILLRKPE